MSDDSFADHPKSIAEIRAERATNGRLWAPRDALLAALREIDAGRLKADCLVICIGNINPDGSTTNQHFTAARDAWAAIGLVSEVWKSLTD